MFAQAGGVRQAVTLRVKCAGRWTRKLDRRDEEQVRPGRLVGEDLDECLLRLCSSGVELDRLVELATG
jgi:hypothetical protein